MSSRLRFGLWLLLASACAWAGPFEDGIEAYDRQQFEKAAQLWLPLAERGHAGAQFNLGVLHEKGLGVEKDPAEAARWYLMAAEQGEIDAQFQVAELYESGTGVEKDIVQARGWYYAVIANAATDVHASELRQRARARRAALASLAEDIVPYQGGRFVIARTPSGPCVVALQGTITQSAAAEFDEVLRKAAHLGCNNPTLLLESPGGLLFESIDLAYKIRRAGFRTVARAACASACAMLFLAGTDRMLVGSRARIGLHQSARGRGSGNACDPTSYSSAARETADYLRSVIPATADQVIALIMQTRCDDMLWIYGQRALDLGITTRRD